MRTTFSPSRRRPGKAIADTAAYLALVTLIVTLFTTSGFVAALAGTLTIGLLVGSYLLERWARRRTATDGVISGPKASDIDESRMAKV